MGLQETEEEVNVKLDAKAWLENLLNPTHLIQWTLTSVERK